VTRRLAVEITGTAIICALIAGIETIARHWQQPWARITWLDSETAA
jgi:hypothetical protein